MADLNSEYVHYDVVVGMVGDEEVKQKLDALVRMLKKTDTSLKHLDKAKASPTVTVKDNITTKLLGIERKLVSISSRAWEGVLTIRDKFSTVINKAWTGLTKVKNLLLSPLGMIGIGMAGMGMGKLVSNSLQLAGNMEQTQLAISTMIGNEEEARKFLGWMEEFAIKTPFEFPDLADATRKLFAYGFSVEETTRMLKTLGNVAAGLGLGAEGISRFTDALGQIRAKGRLSSEEVIKQLGGAGVPALRYLAEGLETNTKNVTEMMEKGLIPANLGVELILRGMEKDSKWMGMLEKQSKTLLGVFSTLKDFFNMKIFMALGQGISEVLLPTLSELTDMLSGANGMGKTVGENFTKLGRDIGTFMVNALNTMMEFVAWLNNPEIEGKGWGEKLGIILNKITQSITDWVAGPGLSAVTTLFTSLGKIAVTAFAETFKGLGKQIWENIKGGNIKEAVTGGALASGLLLPLVKPISKVVKGGITVGKGIGKGAGTIWDVISRGAKIGKYSLGTKGINQMLEAEQLLGAAGAGKKALGVLSTGASIDTVRMGVFDAIRLAMAENKVQAGTQIAGEWGGFLAGSKLGSTIGTMIVPGAGTVIGGILGGLIGGTAGGKGGEWVYEKVANRGKEQVKGTPALGTRQAKEVIPGLGIERPRRETPSLGIKQIENIIGRRATGGIVTQPEISLIGEAGKEAIVPLSSREKGINIWLEAGKELGVILNGTLLKDKEKISQFNTLLGKEKISQFDTLIKNKEISQASVVFVNKRATGGIITQPEISLVGEAGAEAIIPLSSKEKGINIWLEAGRRLGIIGNVGGDNYNRNMEITNAKNEKETIYTNQLLTANRAINTAMESITRVSTSNITRNAYAVNLINEMSKTNNTLNTVVEKLSTTLKTSELSDLVKSFNTENIYKENGFTSIRNNIDTAVEQIGNQFRYIEERKAERGRSVEVNINKVEVSVENTGDIDEIVNEVSRQFSIDFRKALENRI